MSKKEIDNPIEEGPRVSFSYKAVQGYLDVFNEIAGEGGRNRYITKILNGHLRDLDIDFAKYNIDITKVKYLKGK